MNVPEIFLLIPEVWLVVVQRQAEDEKVGLFVIVKDFAVPRPANDRAQRIERELFGHVMLELAAKSAPRRTVGFVALQSARSARSKCLGHLIVFSEANLRRVLSAYVTYYNRWRPHRSLGQAVPCDEARSLPRQACRKIAAAPVLGGLHDIYPAAA